MRCSDGLGATPNEQYIPFKYIYVVVLKIEMFNLDMKPIWWTSSDRSLCSASFHHITFSSLFRRRQQKTESQSQKQYTKSTVSPRHFHVNVIFIDIYLLSVLVRIVVAFRAMIFRAKWMKFMKEKKMRVVGIIRSFRRDSISME